MLRVALPLLVSIVLAGCTSMDGGAGAGVNDSQQASPGNCGCPGAFGRVSGPANIPGMQDAYGRPYPMFGPAAANPPGNAWVARNMMNSSVPLDKINFDGGTSMAMNANGSTPIPVPPGGLISPVGMPPPPGFRPPNAAAQAGGPNARNMPGYGSGLQQVQYQYPPSNPAGSGGTATPYYPWGNPYPYTARYPNNGNYPPYPNNGYYPYNPNYPPNYPYPAPSGYPSNIQKTQFTAGARSSTDMPMITPPEVPFNPQSGAPPSMMGGFAGMAGGAGSCGPGCATGMRTQIRFNRPIGMKVQWFTMGPDGRPVYSVPIETPGRYNFVQGAVYRLKLTNIDEFPRQEFYPTMEVMVGNTKTEAFLSHSAVPVSFTSEDFKQVVDGNYIVKVIYLPDPEYQDVAGTGTDEILSARLEPGVDPIQEARRKGTVLVVIRMGNVDQGIDHTPPLNAPGAPGRSMMGPVCPPQGYPGAGGYGPSYGGSGIGPGFGLGGPSALGTGGPPTSGQRQLLQVPYYNWNMHQQGTANPGCGPSGCPNPQMCPPGMFPGYSGQAPYYCPPGYGPIYPQTGPAPYVPTPPTPKTSQANPPGRFPAEADTLPKLPPPSAATNDTPTSLPDQHETKSSPATKLPDTLPANPNGASGQSGQTAPATPSNPPAAIGPTAVPPVLPETPAGELPSPPAGSIPPPIEVQGPNGIMTGPPIDTGYPPAKNEDKKPSVPTPAPSTPPSSGATEASPPAAPAPASTSSSTGLPTPLPPSPAPTTPKESSVPQTLPASPGLSDVQPPAALPTQKSGSMELPVPAASPSPDITAPTPDLPKLPEVKLPASLAPIDPSAVPAFPESAAPIQPAPAETPLALPPVSSIPGPMLPRPAPMPPTSGPPRTTEPPMNSAEPPLALPPVN